MKVRFLFHTSKPLEVQRIEVNQMRHLSPDREGGDNVGWRVSGERRHPESGKVHSLSLTGG